MCACRSPWCGSCRGTLKKDKWRYTRYCNIQSDVFNKICAIRRCRRGLVNVNKSRQRVIRQGSCVILSLSLYAYCSTIRTGIWALWGHWRRPSAVDWCDYCSTAFVDGACIVFPVCVGCCCVIKRKGKKNKKMRNTQMRLSLVAALDYPHVNNYVQAL